VRRGVIHIISISKDMNLFAVGAILAGKKLISSKLLLTARTDLSAHR